MTNLEYAMKKYEFTTGISLCDVAFHAKHERDCSDANIDCKHCPFNAGYEKELVEFLLQERKEQIKLKQWERDLMDDWIYSDNEGFVDFSVLMMMKDKGYYKGVADTSMPLKEILDNCIIVQDDYDFGGNE